MAPKRTPLMQTLVMDGRLDEAEALAVLSNAARAATHAMPRALLLCTTQEQMQKVISDRDTAVLAYTNSLAKSLLHTGPLFEQTAKQLADATASVLKEADKLKSDIEAIRLFAELARLASKLALAFA